MARTRPGLRRTEQPAVGYRDGALLVWRCGRGALLWLVLGTQSCSLDSSPARPQGGSSRAATQERSAWVPRQGTTITRHTGVTGSTSDLDAEVSTDTMATRDADMHEFDANIEQGSVVDAGRPTHRDSAGPADASTPSSRLSQNPPQAEDSAAPSTHAASDCVPGLYVGEFEGPVTFSVGSVNSVSGSMRAQLVPVPSGNDLEVRDGMMVGEDASGLGMSSGWTGRLNCATKSLENAKHENGSWDNGSRFEGTLEGTYSLDSSSLSGTWRVESAEIPLAGGNGTWHLTLQESPAP